MEYVHFAINICSLMAFVFRSPWFVLHYWENFTFKFWDFHSSLVHLAVNVIIHLVHIVPSVLWRCWLGGRKGIRPVKNRVVGCWRGYLSGARCRLAYAQLIPLPLTVSCFSKVRLVLPFLYRLTRVVLDKRSLNGCVCCAPCLLSARSAKIITSLSDVRMLLNTS